MASAADAGLGLIRTQNSGRDAAFPEVALYQCDSCHRKLDSLSTSPVTARHGLPSGAIPLNDSSLRLLIAVAEALRVENVRQAEQRSAELYRAASLQRSMVDPAIARLQPALQSISLAVVSGDRSDADLRAVRSGLLGLAARGEAAYFPLAFHVYLGVSQLNSALDDGLVADAQMARWFDTVASETAFEPGAFARYAAGLLEQVGR
jgi:hypothetical protein